MRTPLSVLLKDKGSKIYSVSAKESALACINKMNEYGVGALLVMEGETLQGIISERDIIRKLFVKPALMNEMQVSNLMTKSVHTVPSTMTVQEAMKTVTEKRFRHLPVVDNGKLLGMISIGDLTRWVMLAQEHEIAALTGYIQGTTNG